MRSLAMTLIDFSGEVLRCISVSLQGVEDNEAISSLTNILDISNYI